MDIQSANTSIVFQIHRINPFYTLESCALWENTGEECRIYIIDISIITML